MDHLPLVGAVRMGLDLIMTVRKDAGPLQNSSPDPVFVARPFSGSSGRPDRLSSYLPCLDRWMDLFLLPNAYEGGS